MDKVIAGVVVGLETVPANPLALTTDIVLTLPDPAGAAQVPSALRKLVEPPPLAVTTPGKLELNGCKFKT